MTIFAGVVAAEKPERVVPPRAFAVLADNLTRRSNETLARHAARSHAVAMVDFGIFDGGCLRADPSGAFSVIAGEPFIDGGAMGRSRSHQLDRLHEDWMAGSTAVMERARGAFCAVHFNPGSGRLWLIADKLGLRPIYYAQVEGLTLFATALRVFESCPLVLRRGDLNGVAEMACIGYPLGPRTAIESVRVLEAGQVLEVTAGSVRRRQYWRWDRVAPVDASENEMCVGITSEFTTAIRLRLGDRARAVSLLSAGLDSRCVTAMLRALDVDVHTIGFGPDGSTDHALAKLAARALGTQHFEMPHGATEFWPRLAAAHRAWSEGPGREWTLQEAGALWSGEGGDRILAPVNLYEDVIDAMRAGKVDEAISHYMRAEHAGLPRRLFRRRYRDLVRAIPPCGLRTELARFEHADAAKRFHSYVLTNEARRNIKQHFEDLDLSRVELIMPFYDSELVRTVLSYPLDPLVRHRLYQRWLTYLPPVVREIPWQAYPGALPCPVPLPAGLRSQWESWHTPDEQRRQRQARLVQAAEVIGAKEFPDWLLRKSVLRLARRLSQAGFWRFSYLFDVAGPFVAHPPAPLPRTSHARR